MASIELECVTKAFHTRRQSLFAIKNLGLAVADGEILVLLGPSGCGKTTTLRLIAGLETPTAGTIRIGGRVVNSLAPGDRDVALVFQSHALYPHMTAYKNMAFGLRMRGAPRAEIDRRVREAAGMLRIEGLLERRPAALSGGERQRVALGRAIVRTPSAFLLDEPLSDLDAPLRLQLRTEIKGLQRALRTTMVYVTHDQEEAMALGDRILVLNHGEAQQCGTPMEVYDRPANRFVGCFVGSPPMNLLDGRIERDGESFAVSCPVGRFRWPIQDATSQTSGAAIHVGVRPEDVGLVSGNGFLSSPASQPMANWRIVDAEPHGRVTLVRLQSAADQPCVMAVVPGRPPLDETSSVALKIDPMRLHLFSATGTGARLN